MTVMLLVLIHLTKQGTLGKKENQLQIDLLSNSLSSPLLLKYAFPFMHFFKTNRY